MFRSQHVTGGTMISIFRSRPAPIWLLASALIIALAMLSLNESRHLTLERGFEGKASDRGDGRVLLQVINSSAAAPVSVPSAGTSGFTPQTRMGFASGDQWEPAIAADRHGHVYILYPQYSGVPGCPTCFSPTMILQISSDHGSTWSSPTIMYPAGATNGQWDAQIVVDPADGQTVYAAWLQNGKSDIVVGKSTNFGSTWSVVTASSINAGTDKRILVARGPNVYVSFDHTQSAYVAASHDGGTTFSQVKINQNSKLGWSLGGGGTVTPNRNVYIAWDGETQDGVAKGPVNLYVSKSSDAGVTWTTNLMDGSASPPDCSSMSCVSA